MTTLLHPTAVRVVGSVLRALLVAPVLLAAPALARGGPENPPVDPRLIGSWHAEVTTTVLAGDVSLLVRTTWDVTIKADGSASYHAEKTTTGGIGGTDINKREVLAHISGTVVQQGDTLIARVWRKPDSRFRFRLSGNNGLYIDGRLFEKR
jgi:hypothetical protein